MATKKKRGRCTDCGFTTEEKSGPFWLCRVCGGGLKSKQSEKQKFETDVRELLRRNLSITVHSEPSDLGPNYVRVTVTLMYGDEILSKTSEQIGLAS